MGRVALSADGTSVTVTTNSYPTRVIVWRRDAETGEIFAGEGETPVAWNGEFQIDSIFEYAGGWRLPSCPQADIECSLKD